MPWLNGKKIAAKAAEHWVAKAFSIILAIFLFVFHRMSTMEDRFFSVPLAVELEGSMVVSSSYPRMVRISMRGDANSMYPVLEDDIEAFIDLKKYKQPGMYRAPVQIRKRGTALGVEPLQIGVDPIEVNLTLDHRVSKFVPLSAIFRGQVEPGYSLNSWSLNPAQVVIDGPSALINTVFELSTDFIDLDGRTGEFLAAVNILNRDSLITIRGNGVTEFHGFVSKMVSVRNIEDIPLTLRGVDPGFYAETDIKTASIRLEGRSQEELDAYTPPPEFLFVDCSGISESGAYTLPVLINKAADTPQVKSEPAEVLVRIFRMGRRP